MLITGGIAMNKQTAIDCLVKLTGILCLYCTVSFLYVLDILRSVSDTIHLPYWCAATILILTSGFGLTIGMALVGARRPQRELLRGLGVFSLAFLILQAGLTIIPGVYPAAALLCRMHS